MIIIVFVSLGIIAICMIAFCVFHFCLIICGKTTREQLKNKTNSSTNRSNWFYVEKSNFDPRMIITKEQAQKLDEENLLRMV